MTLIPHHLTQWFSAMLSSLILFNLSSNLVHLSKSLQRNSGGWHSQIQDFASWVAISTHRTQSLVSRLMPKLLIIPEKNLYPLTLGVIAFGCQKYKDIQRSSIPNSNNISSIFSVIKEQCIGGNQSLIKFISPSEWLTQGVCFTN